MEFRTIAVTLALAAACSRQPDPAIGRAAAQKATENAREGSESVGRLANGLVEVTAKGARLLGPAMAAPVDVARVRNIIRIDMHDDHTDVGRDLTMYPTWFLAAVGPDGRGIAGDRAPEQDFLVGKHLSAAFPCVRSALQGNGGHCVGELSSGEGQPTRVYLVGAQPTRGADNTINGAFVTAVNFSRLAKAVRETLNLRTAHESVQIYVGFLRNGRVHPSGSDNDVAQAYLVPDNFLRRIPHDIEARARTAPATFTFSENNGQMQWGAAVLPVPSLDGASIIVFRAPLRQ
jgi:hypothetical protein